MVETNLGIAVGPERSGGERALGYFLEHGVHEFLGRRAGGVVRPGDDRRSRVQRESDQGEDGGSEHGRVSQY